MSVAVSDPMTEQPVSDRDFVQLTRLVTEFAWRFDHGEADAVHELFVENGVLDLGGSPLSGRKAIREWGRRTIDERRHPGIRHVCTNMRFVADGHDAAAGVVIITAYLDEGDAEGATLPFAIGEDKDRFARTDQGWRFVYRHWDQLFDRRAR